MRSTSRPKHRGGLIHQAAVLVRCTAVNHFTSGRTGGDELGDLTDRSDEVVFFDCGQVVTSLRDAISVTKILDKTG